MTLNRGSRLLVSVVSTSPRRRDQLPRPLLPRARVCVLLELSLDLPGCNNAFPTLDKSERVCFTLGVEKQAPVCTIVWVDTCGPGLDGRREW
jgi:hypothetical protein